MENQADMYENFDLEDVYMAMNTYMSDLYSHEIALSNVLQNPRKTHRQTLGPKSPEIWKTVFFSHSAHYSNS